MNNDIIRGKLTVITGPMGCGKTLELIVRLKKQEMRGRNVQCFKPAIDTRDEKSVTSSRIGIDLPVIKVTDTTALMTIVITKLQGIEVIGIDEAQLFSNEHYPLWKAVQELIDSGIDVYISGLNQDFQGLAFGDSMPSLITAADDIVHMKSICASCGSEEGSKTQRIDSKGNPVTYGPTIQIGGNDTYEARCHRCWVG